MSEETEGSDRKLFLAVIEGNETALHRIIF